MDETLPRVLIVEDNDADAFLATRSLRGYKAAISILKDGFEALEYLVATCDPKELPELVLLDLSLPEIHGLDILRKLKAQEKTKNLRVVILTGNHQEKVAMDCYKLNCDGVLLKPVTGETIEPIMNKCGIPKMGE